MSDLISRKAAIEILHYNADESCASVVADFESIPTADIEPIRRGWWIYKSSTTAINTNECSECG